MNIITARLIEKELYGIPYFKPIRICKYTNVIILLNDAILFKRRSTKSMFTNKEQIRN
jgi:hypothetical protein